MEEATIYDILGKNNAVVLADADSELVFAWNGSADFLVFQHIGKHRFTLIDSWHTDVRPATLFEAQERCRSRLAIFLREVGATA